MNNYNKIIGLKTIWLTFVRRWKVILIIFIPIVLASVISTQFIMTKKYRSSYTLDNVGVLSNDTYNKIAFIIQRAETINAAVEKLAAEGTSVTASQISSGISIPSWTGNTQYITVSYTSSNKSIIKPILTSLSEASLDALKPSYTSMVISSQPGDPTLASKNTTYLIVGLVASIIFSLGFAFVYEIISDEVYDKADIENLGCGGFDFTVSK